MTTKEIIPLDPEASAEVAEEAKSWLARREADCTDLANDRRYAEWFVNCRLSIEGEIKRLRAQADAMEDKLRRCENYLNDRHKGMAEAAIARLIDAQPGKSKSIDLLTGRAGFRKARSKLSWNPDREKDVVEFLRDNLPAFVKGEYVESIIKTGLAEALEEWSKSNGGLWPEFISVEGGVDQFYVSEGKA